MSYLNTEVLSHAKRVCRLYKKCCRIAESNKGAELQRSKKAMIRRDICAIRKAFDSYKTADPVTARKLLDFTEEKAFWYEKGDYHPFPNSPGGVAYGREPHLPDWILDQWHPLEKAQYPEYFARRDVRKREFIERWEKEYGKPQES